MSYYDIGLAYNNGIKSLYMGGEFLNNNFFREKDILENDYSEPILQGKNEIEEIKNCSISSSVELFLVQFSNGKLFLTQNELEAGFIEVIE